MNKLIKKVVIVAASTTMMATTALAGSWSMRLNRTTYGVSGLMTKTSKNNYATITSQSASSRGGLNVYTKSTFDESYISEVGSIMYPGSSARVYYNGYTSDYVGKSYKTYVKLDATAYYTSLVASGTTTP